MAKSLYEIAVETTYKGKGAKDAAKDMGNMSLKAEVAAQKTAKLESEWKDLARQVATGGKTFAEVEKEADKLTRQMAELDRESKAAGDGVEKSGKSWDGFAVQAAAATAVLVGAGVAAKAAYEYIGQGAELSAAAGKFDNLSVSIGTTSDALLGNLKTATKGMISDAELVAGATDIISLGLAKTEDGTVRLATAVGALGLDLDVLALTLANDSVARLDSLGLSMENVRRTQKELGEQGFKGDTFDEAVIIELEKKMILLGDASETTAGKMQITAAALENISNSAKITAATIASIPMEELSKEATTLASTVENLLIINNKMNESQAESQRGTAELKGGTAAYLTLLNPLALTVWSTKKAYDGLTEGIGWLAIELEGGVHGLEEIERVTASADMMMLQYGKTVDTVSEAERELYREQASTIEQSENYIAATAELDDKFRAQGSTLTQLEIDQRAAAAATREHAEAAAALIEEAEKVSILETYNDALDNADSAYNTGAGGREAYRQSMEDIAGNADIAAQRVNNLSMKILGVPTSVTTTFNVKTSGAIAAIGTLENKIFGAGGAASAGADQSTSASPAEFDPLAKGASGLNMMIPSGFPNDSFPVAAQSGEQLIIRTPQQQRDGTNTGGGGTVNININGGDTGQIMAVVNQALAQAGVSADSRNRMR